MPNEVSRRTETTKVPVDVILPDDLPRPPSEFLNKDSAPVSIRLDISEGLARISICRGDTFNQLDPSALGELDAAWRGATAIPDLRAIELSGEGSAFCAGIDTRWILDRMDEDDLSSIIALVRQGHAFLRLVDDCPVRTILRLDGHAAGAGAEFACAFDSVVATPRASIRFPETGLGIHPAMGGTQRLPRRVGLGPARWLAFTGRSLRVGPALEMGLVTKLVEESAIEEAILEEASLGRGEREWLSRSAVVQGACAPPAFADWSLAELLVGPHESDPVELQRALVRMSRRAPIALRVTDDLMQSSRALPLADGLANEINELATVYSSEDAFTGMRAAVAGRRTAEFCGR